MKHILLIATISVFPGASQELRKPPEARTDAVQPSSAKPNSPNRSYALGIDDQITVRALHVEEITETPLRIDSDGNIRLPLAGSVHAAGLTVGELEEAITARLRPYVLEPEVSVPVMELRD